MAITDPLLCNQEHQNVILIVSNPIKQNRFQIPKINRLSPWPPQRISITVWLGITFGSMEGKNYELQNYPRAIECIAIL